MDHQSGKRLGFIKQFCENSGELVALIEDDPLHLDVFNQYISVPQKIRAPTARPHRINRVTKVTAVLDICYF